MQWRRALRKGVTLGGLRVGMELARRSDGPALVEGLRRLGGWVSRAAVPLRRRLAANMKHAGVYRPELIDAHFERVLDQLIMLAHVFRAGFDDGGIPQRFRFDDTFGRLQQAFDLGRGVINISPHLCGYPLYPRAVQPRIPCSIYLRGSGDPRKLRITEAVGLAGQGHLVYAPAAATPAQRLRVAMDILRQGRMLFITPDTLRKPGDGVPVIVFGQEVYFPTGVFVMAMRTGAPVVPTVWHWQTDAYHVRYGEPIELPRRGNKARTIETAVRQWAASVDTFLHDHPEMWWNWLDKRWTYLLRLPKIPAMPGDL